MWVNPSNKRCLCKNTGKIFKRLLLAHSSPSIDTTQSMRLTQQLLHANPILSHLLKDLLHSYLPYSLFPNLCVVLSPPFSHYLSKLNQICSSVLILLWQRLVVFFCTGTGYEIHRSFLSPECISGNGKTFKLCFIKEARFRTIPYYCLTHGISHIILTFTSTALTCDSLIAYLFK